MKDTRQVVRFVLVGTLNALITTFVVWVMMGVLGCNYLWSNVAAYLIAQLNNFFWSKFWVFSSGRGDYLRQFLLFACAFACAYGAQFFCLLLMVELLEWNEYFAQFLGLFVYGAVNFLMNKRVTFRK